MDSGLTGRDPPFLRNVGLLTTYHCQASCAHCILRAGPDRHEKLMMADAERWISAIAAYREGHVYVLSLTGGEPFSHLAHLRTVLSLASGYGLHASVVTNAFWASSAERACEVLGSLPRIGFVSISTDAYHLPYVPLQRVQNAIGACKNLGIPYYVSVVTESQEDSEYQRLLASILETTASDQVRIGLTFPVGRAEELSSSPDYRWSDIPPREACQASSSPCIFPDGRTFGCIGPLLELRDGHPLFLGNVREQPVEEVFDAAESNVLLHALRIWGPARLVAMLKESGMAASLPTRYVAGSICNACHAIFSHDLLRQRILELVTDAEFRRKVAYARLHYLSESRMLELGGYQSDITARPRGV